MLVIGHLRWSRQARQALFNICSIWGVSKILVWSYNFKGVLAGRFSHLWPTLYNNGFKDPRFIDLLINFTMLPYSTYFYTGSIHVQFVALQEYFSHPRLVIYFTFFPRSPITNETWTAKGKTSNSTSNPHGPIKVSEKPHHPVQKCLVETIFAEPNRHALTLYMRDIFAGSHTEHCWRSQLTAPFFRALLY
jgi:hypothetical protein